MLKETLSKSERAVGERFYCKLRGGKPQEYFAYCKGFKPISCGKRSTDLFKHPQVSDALYTPQRLDRSYKMGKTYHIRSAVYFAGLAPRHIKHSREYAAILSGNLL